MQVQFLTWQLSVERIKPTPEELVETYNSIADQWQQKIQRFGYDRAYASLFTGLHDDLRNSFTKSETMHSTTSVLDCGVGSGALSAALFKSNIGHLRLYGVDTSPEMATVARTHLAQQGISIQTRRQDVRNLPYTDNMFGMVMTAHTIEHLPRPQVGIQEMVRVLQPDAPLLIMTTRPSFLGSLVDLQWGLTCMAEAKLVEMFENAGLYDVQPVQFGGPFWCRRMSYALIGWKRQPVPS
ncbi:MAG: class I SAM-dependent methyltransferase [Chloroflexota bacterium]